MFGISIKKTLALVSFVMLLLAFVGCDLAGTGVSMEDAASRTMKTSPVAAETNAKGKAPQSFTATVNLYQDYTSVVTRSMGNSNHYKTVEETLYSAQYGPYGGLIVSDWDVLNNKNVVMSNVTNYNLDPVSGEISGSNHSVIHVVDEQGAIVLTLQANGTLGGSIFGAGIQMNWVLKESYGLNVQARGKIGGEFVWAIFNPQTMSVEYVLPNGTFTLTGTYN